MCVSGGRGEGRKVTGKMLASRHLCWGLFVGDIGLALGESGNFLAPKSQKRSCIAARGLGDYKEIGSRKTSSRSFSRGLVVICLCVYR